VLVGSDNAEKIYKFLVGKGLTPFQAAGIMGNIKAESGFNPGIVEGGSGIGYGIIQWSFGRRTKLEAAAAAKGVPVSDLAFQLDYLWEELNQSYKGPLDAIKASTTLEEATEIFETKVEIHAAPPIQPARKDFARAILALYGSEGGSTGTTGGSSSASASCSTPTATSGSTIDANLPQGTKDELITQIKDTHNVAGDNLLNTQMKRTTLAVILKLAQKYKFTATSTIRGGGGPHSNGSAIDIVNINGKGVPSGQDYAPINEDADNFARDAATLLPGHSWMGVPNDHYKQIANPIMTTKGGSSDLDTPATTGATGPHFHLNCPADAE
ncbi:hypothetical protein H0W80_03985, partial [Candidatus Saccharibacteria bacterium]|nr:hypothetical protein [Candidatus Saccharibacteria bacterium]